MIAATPVTLTASSPQSVFQAQVLGLKTLSQICIENYGPGAIQIRAGGTIQSLLLDTIGSFQRKTIILGGLASCMLCLNPIIGTLTQTFPPNTLAQFQSVNAAAIFDDDYSLARSDYRRGNTASLSGGGGLGQGSMYSTDFGLDKFRGIYIPLNAIENPVGAIYTPDTQTNQILDSLMPGQTIELSTTSIFVVGLDKINFSDDPIVVSRISNTIQGIPTGTQLTYSFFNTAGTKGTIVLWITNNTGKTMYITDAALTYQDSPASYCALRSSAFDWFLIGYGANSGAEGIEVQRTFETPLQLPNGGTISYQSTGSAGGGALTGSISGYY